MEALLPPKHPASVTVSQARCKRLRLHLRHLKFQRFLLSTVLQVRRLRRPLSKAMDRQPNKPVMASKPVMANKQLSNLVMASNPVMVSRLAMVSRPRKILATVSSPAMASSPAMVSRPAKSRTPAMASRPAMARNPDMVSRPDMDNRQDMESRQRRQLLARSMASSPPPRLLALSSPSNLRSQLLLADTAPTQATVLRRVLLLTPSALDSISP